MSREMQTAQACSQGYKSKTKTELGWSLVAAVLRKILLYSAYVLITWREARLKNTVCGSGNFKLTAFRVYHGFCSLTTLAQICNEKELCAPQKDMKVARREVEV